MLRRRRQGFITGDLPLNTLCNPAYWNDPEWRAIGRLLALSQDEGWLHRKAFEWTHCVYGLERLGVLGPDRRVLGVAAGHECTLYHLANRTGLTVATDLYSGGFASSHAAEADAEFLTNPAKYAPFQYREPNLVALPADALHLPFERAAFDVVYSLSSIEHFGGHDKAAAAIREMERVVRPGGIVCVATEFVLRGEQHGEYFTRDDLEHWVVGASPNLRLIGPIDFTFPAQEYFDDHVPLADDPFHHPHIVLKIHDWYFTSVILFFEKLGDSVVQRAKRVVGRALAARG